MRLGLCLHSLADRKLVDALRFCRDAGIDCVDVPLDSNLCILGDRPTECMPELTHTLRDAGISVCSVSNSRDCQLILGPHGAETDGIAPGNAAAKRRHGLAKAREALRVAAALGAPTVQLALGCPSYARWFTWPNSDRSWDDNVDELVEALGEVRADVPAGVTVALEPQPKQVVYDTDSARSLLRRLPEGVAPPAICYDPANLAAVGDDPLRFLDEWGRPPDLVHAKDVEIARPGRPCDPADGWVRYGPQRPVRFRTLGWGELPWEAILTRLREIGYDGVVLVEHQDVLARREAGIRASLAYLRERQILQKTERRWW
jgi:sugar phosphate isomerase/epimerase